VVLVLFYISQSHNSYPNMWYSTCNDERCIWESVWGFRYDSWHLTSPVCIKMLLFISCLFVYSIFFFYDKLFSNIFMVLYKYHPKPQMNIVFFCTLAIFSLKWWDYLYVLHILQCISRWLIKTHGCTLMGFRSLRVSFNWNWNMKTFFESFPYGLDVNHKINSAK
jgi:hypothetical protein